MEFSPQNTAFLSKLVIWNKLLSGKTTRDYDDCFNFWDSDEVFQWFQEKGYTLYRRATDTDYLSDETHPRLPFAAYQEFAYPYACHDAQPNDGGALSLTAVDTSGRIVYAQDTEGRHVAIKATSMESEEYRILRFLDQQGIEVLKQNCILPVLEFLPYEKTCFVVMPRWGMDVSEPVTCRTMKDTLTFMESALKALTFLHSLNIIHRDISFSNFVINHFGDCSTSGFQAYWRTRRQHFAENKVVYAIIDFDLAIMVPPEVERDKFMLPARESYVGTYGPTDTSQGEFEYNPFAFDVGALGVMFCQHYQYYTKYIPLLAPFLDRMVTRDIQKRFTAAEALCFVQKIIAEATEAQLSWHEGSSYENRGYYETFDRWEALPADFQEKWSAYREPLGIPRSTRLLRAIVDSKWLPGSLVPKVRKLISICVPKADPK